MLLSCQTCHGTFVRPYSLRRHMIMVHGHLPTLHTLYAIESIPRFPVVTSFQLITEPTRSSMPPNNAKSSPLAHLFTMQICGPCFSGKMVWLQNVLASKNIQPLFQRIIWCYGQWQPAYTQMSRNLPNVKFVRGIPDDLERDSYFDTSVNNLIVLAT
jgi:hypothetical protein